MIRFFSNCPPFLSPSFLPSPPLLGQLGNYSVRYDNFPQFSAQCRTPPPHTILDTIPASLNSNSSPLRPPPPPCKP